MATTFASEPVRLTADHVSVVLGDGRRLLDAVSLTVHPHEVIAIIGRSGAGKTTLLDTLAGVRAMTVVGRAIGAITSDRSAFIGSAVGPSLVMAAVAILLMAGAHTVVARRTRPA